MTLVILPYPQAEYNLNRARTQSALVSDMETGRDEPITPAGVRSMLPAV